MKYIQDFISYKTHNEGILSNLKNGALNMISKKLGGDVAKIDKLINTYSKQMTDIFKEENGILQKLSSKKSDPTMIERFKKILTTLDKKKALLDKKIVADLTKLSDNDRKKAYAAVAKNKVDIQLLDNQLNILSELDIESDIANGLLSQYNNKKEESANKIKTAEEAIKKMTKEEPVDVNKEKKSKTTEQKTRPAVGDMLKYTSNSGEVLEREIVEIKDTGYDIKTSDGRIVFISNNKAVV